MAELALIYNPTTGRLISKQVGTDHLAAGALAATTSGRAIMADGFIISAKIDALAIGTGHLADGAITSAKIGAGIVGGALLQDAGVVSGKVAALAIQAANINWGAIASGKVATGAILSGNIVSGQVGVSHIVSFDPLRAAMINFVVDGGGSEIKSGAQGHLIVPFGGTIQEVSLLGDQSGAIRVDIWRDTYSNFPPTSVDTIASGLKPLISGGFKYQDATLTNWLTSLTSGDVLAYHVDLVSSLTRVTVGLRVLKT